MVTSLSPPPGRMNMVLPAVGVVGPLLCATQVTWSLPAPRVTSPRFSPTSMRSVLPALERSRLASTKLSKASLVDQAGFQLVGASLATGPLPQARRDL